MKKISQPLLSFLKIRLITGASYLFWMAGIVAGHSAFAQPLPWQQKKIDSLFSHWNNQKGPGMELMILHKGKVILRKSYGLANIEHKTPNSSKGRIWVASMSKQFTALAIALLVDQRKISLEDDIRKYLPELPSFNDPVKIRNLVYHTSGLREGFVLTAMSFKAEKEYSNENVIKYLSRQKETNFKPGERFEYNNGGYVLLATIVERVSGQSFPDFVQQNIFRPLGMNQSSFHAQFPVKDSGIAMGYSVLTADNKTIYQPAYFKGNSYGSTGLVTTAEDLAKWDRIFYQPVFGKQVQQMQLQKGKLNNGQSIPYGFGLEIEDFKGKKAITHSGADAGYKSEMVRFPQDEFTVICLANTEDGYNNTDRLFKVAQIFVDFKGADPVASSPECEPVESVYINKETLASMRFVQQSGRETTVSTSHSGYKQPLTHRKKCSYTIKDLETDSYTFRHNELLYVSRANNEIYQRIIKKTSTSAELKEMAGAYYSEELDVSYTLFEKDGVLYLKFFDVYDVPLTAYEGDLFVGEFLGMNTLSFVKNLFGKTVGMKFNREGIYGLSFTRK